jgi:hypothetical protein
MIIDSTSMNFLRRLQSAARLLACGMSLTVPSITRAAGSDDITAVSARVSNDYVRTKLADGSFRPETYAFGAGGVWGGSIHDDAIDRLKLIDIARTLVIPLAEENYLPTKDPNQTNLLIMVYWGTTTGGKKNPFFGGGVPDGNMLDRFNAENARLLGYDTALAGSNGHEFGAAKLRGEDLINELEDNRYFVVLIAYDFELLWKEKKRKLLWETRFSIREQDNDFSKVLPGMSQYASRYFGQDSHGLLRKAVPEGHVDFGELKVIEAVPNK